MELDNIVNACKARREAIAELDDESLLDAEGDPFARFTKDEEDVLTYWIVQRAHEENLIPEKVYDEFNDRLSLVRKMAEAILNPYINQARKALRDKVEEEDYNAYIDAEYVVPRKMIDDVELEKYYGHIDFNSAPCMRRKEAERIFWHCLTHESTSYNNVHDLFRAATPEDIAERGIKDDTP